MTEKKPVIYQNPMYDTGNRPNVKCPMHNMWMRKGQCEICRLNADKLQQQKDAEAGVVKHPVKIGKL